jgi:hypothetical protein
LTDALRFAAQRTRIGFGGSPERANAALAPLSADEQRLVTMLLRKPG